MTIFSKPLKLLRLSQMEHLPSKQRVAGSSPAGVARNSKKINGFSVYPFNNVVYQSGLVSIISEYNNNNSTYLSKMC